MATNVQKVAEDAQAVFNAGLRKLRQPACPPKTRNGSTVDPQNPQNGDARRPFTQADADRENRKNV